MHFPPENRQCSCRGEAHSHLEKYIIENTHFRVFNKMHLLWLRTHFFSEKEQKYFSKKTLSTLRTADTLYSFGFFL
jgi:hypothetical protein